MGFCRECDNGLFFAVFEPPIAWNPAVVLVDLTVALTPVVEFTLRDTQPGNKLLGRDPRPLEPIASVVDDLVTSVVEEPKIQSEFPKLFF